MRTKRRTPEKRLEPGFGEKCAAKAEAGDVLGLLELLRSRTVLALPASAMDHLAMAIRRRETDVNGLIDVALSEIVGFTTLMLVRCQMAVEKRLAESDHFGGDPVHVPPDLDADGWLERVERLSRFLVEVAAARARIEHVSHLNEKATRKDQHGHRGNNGSSMGGDHGEASPSETPPHNGRVHPQTGRLTLS